MVSQDFNPLPIFGSENLSLALTEMLPSEGKTQSLRNLIGRCYPLILLMLS